MNRLKKYASLLLALVMALALAVPAMASEAPAEGVTTGSITISNASKGHTYEAYQVFKGDLSYDSATGSDLTNPVLSNVTWGASVNEEAVAGVLANTVFANKTAAEIAAYLSDSETGGEATAREFAQAINGALTTPVKTGTVEEGATSCTIAEVPFGYYLIKDKAADLGEGEEAPKDDAISLFMLQVVGPTTVASKVDIPTPDKKIVEDDYVCGLTESETEGGHKHTEACKRTNVADYDIGETITFELTAKLPNNFENYKTYTLIFHDTMSEGLTYTADSVVVTVSREGVTVPGHTVNSQNVAGETLLTVTFAELANTGLKNGDTITVTYKATLNANAEIGNPGNPNKMHLEFSNNPNDEGEGDTGETPDKVVVVFTYELDGTKVDGQDKNDDGSYNKLLKDAEFHLARKDAAGEYEWYTVDPTTGKISWAKADENAPTVKDRVEDKDVDVHYTGSVIKSGEDGKFAIEGLDQDTYYLFETKAPVGYNLPNKHVILVIKATYEKDPTTDKDIVKDLTLTVDTAPSNGDTETGIVNTTIENNKGATLPETGGIGTTIFYALGGLLTVGAVVLLVTKKRMSADEK